jgi:RNA polymerase sigma-70 factor (ECF subfamily)
MQTPALKRKKPAGGKRGRGTDRNGPDRPVTLSPCHLITLPPSHPDPDVELMLRVQADDSGAFAELVRRYWARVFAYFCRQLGDRQEAEDLTQEVFLRLYRHRKRYQPRAKFVTWLFHIVQNLVRNALRFRRRHPHLRPGATDAPDAGRPVEYLLRDRGESPSQPLERRELAWLVRSAVAELADRQRTAMELHQFHDRTYAEIAAAMDMSPKAAKSLLYRARNQLRAALTPLLERE